MEMLVLLVRSQEVLVLEAVLYTARVIEAILSIRDKFIKWPSRREKKRTSDYFEERHKLKGCIGIVDGTFVNLCQKPQVDRETYKKTKVFNERSNCLQ